MLVEQLEDEEDGKTFSFVFRIEGLLDVMHLVPLFILPHVLPGQVKAVF